jgi:hypothetical protein
VDHKCNHRRWLIPSSRFALISWKWYFCHNHAEGNNTESVSSVLTLHVICVPKLFNIQGKN